MVITLGFCVLPLFAEEFTKGKAYIAVPVGPYEPPFYSTTTENRLRMVMVNDQVIASSLDFPWTESGYKWKTQSIDAILKKGRNKVQLTRIGKKDPNIYFVRVLPKK